MKALLNYLLLAALFLVATPGSARDIRAVLEPKEQTLVTAEISSTVKEINRKMGESFKKEQELVLLDDVVFLANLTKTKAQVSKAQADFESAAGLYKDKVISHSEYRGAEAALAVAKADLTLAQKAFDACFIKAPYDGKVVDVYVRQYERVQPGQKIIAILDDSVLIARVLIPDEYLEKISIGDVVSLNIQETNSEEKGTIVRIGAGIDPVSSLVKIEAEINNSEGKLRPGMEGTLVLKKSENNRP